MSATSSCSRPLRVSVGPVADGRRPKGETDGRSERGGTAADRLWPVLLDRLTDDAPDQRKEAPAAVVMTMQRRAESATSGRGVSLRDCGRHDFLLPLG